MYIYGLQNRVPRVQILLPLPSEKSVVTMTTDLFFTVFHGFLPKNSGKTGRNMTHTYKKSPAIQRLRE